MNQSSRHWDSWGSFRWRSDCVKSYVHIAILQVAMLFKITYTDPVLPLFVLMTLFHLLTNQGKIRPVLSTHSNRKSSILPKIMLED